MLINLQRTAAVLIILAANGTNARPTTPSGVALTACYPKTCNSINSKFNYLVGQTYVYDYESYVSTCFVVEGTDYCDSEPSKKAGYTAFTAKVHLTVENTCEMSLSLSDVAVSGVEGATDPEKFAAALTAQPTMFSFVDGTIEDVCSVSGDSKFAVNVKKAIISLFQHTGEDLSRDFNRTEVDLNGECLMNYEYFQQSFWGPRVGWVKTTTLGSCIRKENRLVLPEASVNMRSRAGNQNLPPAQGRLRCDINMAIREDIYLSIDCAVTKTSEKKSEERSYGTKSTQKISYLYHNDRSINKPTVDTRETLEYSRDQDILMPEAIDTEPTLDTEETLEYSHGQAKLVPEVSPTAALEKPCGGDSDKSYEKSLSISPAEKINISMNIVTDADAMRSKDFDIQLHVSLERKREAESLPANAAR